MGWDGWRCLVYTSYSVVLVYGEVCCAVVWWWFDVVCCGGGAVRCGDVCYVMVWCGVWALFVRVRALFYAVAVLSCATPRGV